MAETFDDLYSNLRGNPEFSELFSTPGDFETFLKEEPNADQHIKELFDVDNASGYLKKKDQGEGSISNSLLGGINAYEPKKVVEPAPLAGQPKTQAVSRTQPELILSKQVDGVINTIATETNNPYKALNQLVELNKTLKNPSYKALVSGGKLGNEWVALNQKIGELYKSTPMIFDNPQTKKLLAEMGLQDPSAKAFGQQQQYKPGTFTAPAKTAADYAAERKQAQLQRTGDISQRGVSKETLATQQEQQKTAGAAEIAKQTEQLTPTVQFNQATGQMEEKVSESQDWGSALKGIENDLNSYDELRVKQNEGVYSTQDEQDFTERRRAQVENDFVAKLQPQIDKITADISDNFESEKEVMGGGIFFKRDRDGFLAVDPAYLNKKVDDYIDNQKPGDDLYLPNTEQGNQYKKDLKQAIKAQLTGEYNAILTNKIAEGRIGKFDITKVEAKAAKEAVDYVSQYDGKLSSEVKTYTNTLFDPILKYEKEEGARINGDIEQLNALVENKAIDEQTYFATRTSLQQQVEDLSTQSMNMRIDATAKANTYLAQKKKSRIKDLENFESQVQGKYKDLVQKEYEDYKKKYVGAITSYKNEQQDANAASWQIVGGLIMPDLDILDDLQSSLATIASSSIQLSGIQDYNIDFVDSTINNLSKIAVGNQYMGRSLSNSRSFIEGLGAVTQQLIDQVPTIGTAAAMGIVTRNPYLTSAFMMYTDLAREAQNVQSDIINGGGTAAEAQTAKGKVIDQHLLMTPLYFGQGSLLTGAASKAGSTSFAANYFKGLAMEYPLELTQEVWQEYTGQKFSGALKKEDGTNKSFGEWLSTDGANLAVDLLPTIALLGGAQAVSETSLNRKIIGDYQAVNKFLGDKNLAQFVSDTYNVMGENMVNLIPEHLRATGQITDSEFQDLKKKFKNYVGQLADVDKIGITNLDDSRYYMYQLNEIERAKADLGSATNPSTKNAIQKKIDGLQNNVDNLIQGKEVNYVKFTFSNGASFVMSEEDAAKNLKDLNPLTNMMGAEITNKKGDKVPMLTMETSNAKLNKAQQEIFKRQEKRKEATGVVGINLGEQEGGATINNKAKLEGIIASSKVDEDTARLRTEEAQLAQSYLDQEMPGVKIVFFNDKDYQAFMPKVKGNKASAGNIAVKYNEDTKKYEVEIHINLEKANSKTIGHEVTHAVLLKTFGEDIGKFTEFRQTISKLVSATDNEVLNNFARGYNLDVQAEEYLAELAGLITSEGANIEKGTILKMMTYISDFISKLTGGKVQPFKNVQDMNEAIDFFNSLSDNLSRAKNKDAVQKQTASQVPVQSEARVGEEMEQGKPQAESQVPTEEGKKEEVTTESPLTPAEQEIKQEEIADFVENADEFNAGIAILVNPNQTFNSVESKSQIGVYEEAVLNGESFSNPLPTKTLKEIAKQYDGRLFIITSDGTGYGIDSEGNPIFGGFGFLTHPQNQKDGVGFASVDTSTVKSTVTSIRKFYGNSKVAVLVMIQPPYTTINNSYGSHYFIRSMKQLASNPKQLLEAKNSFKEWVTSNKDAMRNLKKEDSKSGKRNTLSALFNLIDSIDANTDVNAFTKEFLKDTTFDSRKAILQGLMPDKESLQINKNTPIIKKLLLENGFNTESFLAEYGDKTFLSDDVIKSDVGGFVVGGFEINVKPEEEMLKEIEALQSKGFVHPLFNGKLPGSNHFALDGLYGVNENFAKFNLPQTIIDYKAVADKFQNENLIPSKKPNKNAIEGAVYADDKINQLVQNKFKNEGDYKEEAVDKLKGNYPPNQTINFETQILPQLRYTDLKGAKKIEFKKTIAQPMGILKNQVADVSTDIAKGIGFQPSVEGKEAMKTAEFVKGFASKSQIDNFNIGPEYQTAIASGKNNVEAYGDLIKTAYTLTAIKDQLGSSFDQDAYDKAISNDALETMNKFQEGMRDKIDDVKGVLQLNYISLNDTSALSDIRADLREQGYSDLPIFTAFIEMDFATPEQLQEVFGAEYRKTIQDAINRKSDFSSDFLNDLSEDEQNIKIENKAADLTNAFVENGLTFLDASVGIEYLLKYLNDAGLLSMASTLRDSLKDMKNDPKEVQKFFQTFSQLSSMAGRILNMARFIFEKQLVDMIADSLSKNGIVLTTAQTRTLENLANDFKQANAKVQENKKALEEDWSDEAFNTYWASEKELGLANVRLMQFLDARKPNFWNDRLTSGGARGLLNFGTTVLSFTSNIENNLYSTNPINRGIQKLADKAYGGIQGTTLSRENWKLARELTKKQSNFEMSQAFKYGNMQDVNTLNRYYDGLGQINFFRDAQWSGKFALHFMKMVAGKEPKTMTDEEFVDAFDQTLIRMKDGDVKLRDGRTYTIAKSFFWTMSLGPQASELTGRVMAYGGDIMFGQMAAQRAVIDYLNNTKDTRFEKGLFENQFKESNGELSKEAIRAMSLMIFSDPELKNKFEQEGLKRTLLADNFISTGFGFARGALRKEISRLYGEMSKEKGGIFTSKNVKKQLLQASDVLLWTLMPFSKVPANFLGSALMKVIPGAAMAKSIVSGYQYNSAKNKFETKHPIGKKYITEREKKNYEKDKIDLFAKKRQATYDVAQIATAIAIQSFALSAVKSGALLLGDDEEKNKNLKGMNLRGGLYNASLHAEYLIAKGKNLTNYFTGDKDINTKVFLAKRGGYAKEGDNILNINNLGFIGYGMGLWGSIWEGEKNKEQASILSFANYSTNSVMSTLDYAVGNGVENLPMFQGIARIGAIVKDAQKDKTQSTSNTLSNFLGGTFSTSLAVFFPSFGSFMSKGNAELIQSSTEIFPNKETNWPAIWGKAVITTVQKLNRNVAFTEELKNPYYESMVGPFGEDLSYRVTLAEPGTMGAYFQAMFDPFAIRNYSLPVKEADKDKRLHRMSAEVHAGFMDLTMIYQQLTGRNFVFSSEGASASVYEMISNPMKNSFQYDGTDVTLMGPDSSRNPKVFTYNLPNDLYRQELKLRGEHRAKTFANWNQTVKDAKAKVSTLVDQDENEKAEIILENAINSFQTLSSKAQQEYMAEYKNNRMKEYFIIMKQRGLVSESMMEQMKNVGLADADGLISK